jgi:general secretion pathway protein E
MMQGESLPFAFARDNQVALEHRDTGPTLLTGPQPTLNGLSEGRRRAGAPVGIEALSKQAFESKLTSLYQGRDQQEDEDALLFDLSDNKQGAEHRDLLEDRDDAPVIQLVNNLLRQAIVAGASDLHVEPHEDGLRARMRVDGFLQNIFDRADVPVKRIVSRLKVMADLDIAETRLPQDGRISLRIGGRVIDTRVSSLPGNYGERIVLRILDRSTGLLPLDQLGLNTTDIETLTRLAAMPNGIILATGPTGSGKSTTLYSLLNLSNRDERNVVTVEDPIEYDLPGVSQSQIHTEIGMSFAAGLRATLRQDPDIILVGEIRDSETASVATQAALTGHLVFSSLHANSTAGAVVRMRDLGVDSFLISSTLRGVIAQRLLRSLCSSCAKPVNTTATDAALFEEYGFDAPTSTLEATGCSDCNNTGYRGRFGIFEVLTINSDLRAALDAGATETSLKTALIEPKNTLMGQGLLGVISGRTTLVETLRIVGDGQ